MIRIAACFVALASPALASCEEAWATFRSTVEASCAAHAGIPRGAKLHIEVNPFGSDRYGIALLTIRLPDGTVDRSVCIMDKQSLDTEITAPFAGSDWPSIE